MKAAGFMAGLVAVLAVMPTYADFLPTTAQAEAAIEALPMVRAAQARTAEAQARGDALAASPYGFEFNLMPGARHEHATSRTYDEWEASLVRRLRLPNKAALDRALGASGVEAASLALGDTRHMGARLLLERWFAWLRAAFETRVAQGQLSALQAEEAAIVKRVTAGDLALLDGDRAAAARAQAEFAVRQRRLERDQARLALVEQFPAVVLPTALPEIPAPTDPLPDADTMVALVVARSHEIGLALALGRRQDLTAARARSERLADPSVGLRVLDESNSDQQVLGLVLNVPFAAPRVRADAIAEGHLAAAAAAEAELVRQDITRAARQLVLALPGRREAWQSADASHAAASAARSRVERAFALGEAGFADLTLARRAEQEAEREEMRARLDAHQARLELAIDSHQLWSRHVDDDEHAHAGIAMPER
jgi:outer membrane protein, heavy metal efflux system